MKQARFWEYHSGSAVRIKINAGQTLHCVSGGPTDEGYSYDCKSFSFDGATLVVEWTNKARDCDGQYDSGGVATCSARRLAGGYRDDEAGVTFPAWEAQDDEAFQRDHSAEAMNY